MRARSTRSRWIRPSTPFRPRRPRDWAARVPADFSRPQDAAGDHHENRFATWRKRPGDSSIARNWERSSVLVQLGPDFIHRASALAMSSLGLRDVRVAVEFRQRAWIHDGDRVWRANGPRSPTRGDPAKESAGAGDDRRRTSPTSGGWDRIGTADYPGSVTAARSRAGQRCWRASWRGSGPCTAISTITSPATAQPPRGNSNNGLGSRWLFRTSSASRGRSSSGGTVGKAAGGEPGIHPAARDCLLRHLCRGGFTRLCAVGVLAIGAVGGTAGTERGRAGAAGTGTGAARGVARRYGGAIQARLGARAIRFRP